MNDIPGLLVIHDVAEAHFAGEAVPERVVHPHTGEEVATVAWHASDAWRGWYEATPTPGWVKVGEGCNCGNWEDTPPGTSQQEVEAQLRELAAEHEEILLVICGGSNAFAVQYDVLAPARTSHLNGNGARL